MSNTLVLEGLTVASVGGDHFVVAGDKKPIPERFDRHWQNPLPRPSAECVFETAQKRSSSIDSLISMPGPNWYLIRSDFAPENPHLLIIPHDCWPEERMRSLGGINEIHSAFLLAFRYINKHEDGRGLLGLSIQVGTLAAQNEMHLHYHLYRPNMFKRVEHDMDGSTIVPIHNPKPAPLPPRPDENCFVYGNNLFEVYAGGHYTGQCLIFPKGSDTTILNIHSLIDLTDVIDTLVRINLAAFKSVQGLPPDYSFEIRFYDRQVVFGAFTPKLNNTGTLEWMALFDPRIGMNLAWAHAKSAELLRSVIK